MTEIKIQYFMSDLAYKLQIGEIREIHVAEQNGVPVLRITCDSEPKYDYKTVIVPKRDAKKKTPAKKPAATEPQTFTEKFAAGAKDFLFNPARNKGKFGDGGRFG